MAAALKDTPAYTDQIIAWHNQRIWWVACALIVLLAGMIADRIRLDLQPPSPPFVLAVNDQGNPVGQVLPVTSVRVIPDAFLRARLADFIHDAFTVDRDSDEEDYLYRPRCPTPSCFPKRTRIKPTTPPSRTRTTTSLEPRKNGERPFTSSLRVLRTPNRWECSSTKWIFRR